MVQVELVDFPKPWLLFHLMIGLSLGYAAFAFYRKWLGWSRGMRESTVCPSDSKTSSRIWLSEVFLQRQLFMMSFPRWIIHIMIFYGFIGLSLLSVANWILNAAGYLTVSSSLPRFYLRPEGYLFVKIWGDSFGLLLLLGLGMGSIRRFMLPEARETSNQMDIILLVLLLSITLSGFALEGLRLTIMPAEIARYSYVGHFFSPPGMRAVEQLRPWLTACWILHFSLVVALIAYVPHSKLMHSILAPVIIGMNAAEENKRGDLYWPDKKKYREARSPRG